MGKVYRGPDRELYMLFPDARLPEWRFVAYPQLYRPRTTGAARSSRLRAVNGNLLLPDASEGRRVGVGFAFDLHAESDGLRPRVAKMSHVDNVPVGDADTWRTMVNQYVHIHVEPVAGALGAEISGVDVGGDLRDEVVNEIRAAFLEHRVVFFRDQQLSPAAQAAFGCRLGELEDYPFVQPLPDHPKIIPVIKEPDDVGNFGGGWHTDLIYRPEPPLGTMLYALEVPQRGGDTLFADGVAAYDALSPRMQALLGTLEVEYNVRHIAQTLNDRGDSSKTGRSTGNRSMRRLADEEVLNTSPIHPLVRTHPETNIRGLYFSREHTINFAGMTSRESRPLLDWLQNHMTQPVFTTRFHWAAGSMAFWDNRCVSHYALNDYPGERRHMHRLTIAGDVPR